MQTCEIDVVDLFFDETFNAEPQEGDFFHEWRKEKKYFCGRKAKPCRLYTSGFEGEAILMAILESDDVFFLEPVFLRDLAGEWRVETVEDASGCDEGITNYPHEILTFEQSGKSLNLGGISANLENDVVSWTRTYSEPPGKVYAVGTMTVSRDGNQMSGRETWEYSESEYSCQGHDNLTASRLR